MPEDEIDPEQEGLDPNIREALRGRNQIARDKEAAEQKAAALERELAFAKAGVPDTPLTSTLAKSYDGENDPASVKAYFEGLGVDLTAGAAPQQTPPAPQGATEDEIAHQRQIAQVGAGADLGGDVDYAEALSSAKSVDEVQRLLAAAPPEARVTNKIIE
jgi:hypothetical protein